jgi:uncharacterized protein (TIGR03032 family)
MKRRVSNPSELWDFHSAEWREPAQICSQWRDAAAVDPRLLKIDVSRNWWGLLSELGLTLLITREYEHLAVALSAPDGQPRLSYLALPHPSGLVVNRKTDSIHVASTRNPNQVYTLRPVKGALQRTDMQTPAVSGTPLVPVSSAFYPGCLYLHDLALFGSDLYGNAVGQNAVARLRPDGSFDRLWWPKCVERAGARASSCNYIQLNSIAAGKDLGSSFFSASSSRIGRRRPGHLNYPVDRRGVIFSGHTREPMCTGLTRPHSARLRQGKVWVANSGYGELGYVSDGRLEVVCRLPGWTRGLCLVRNVAFVATSRVLPRYANYAPGLDVSQSRCAVHAVSCESGVVLGSVEWPAGNQIFAIDWISNRKSTGFLFDARYPKRDTRPVFYAYHAQGVRRTHNE